MKVAFVGKGGSGKTTLAALFSRHAAEQGRHVLAIDADINQHLAVALGLTMEDAASLPPMGLELDRHLRLREVRRKLGHFPHLSIWMSKED